MAGTDKVLVYEYRAGRKDQPKVMTVDEVDEKVRKSKSSQLPTHSNNTSCLLQFCPGCGSLQKTTLDIKGKSSVTVTENDLRTAEQQQVWSSKPNSEANVASVQIPFVTRMTGKLSGKYQELTILSAAKVVEGM